MRKIEVPNETVPEFELRDKVVDIQWGGGGGGEGGKRKGGRGTENRGRRRPREMKLQTCNRRKSKKSVKGQKVTQTEAGGEAGARQSQSRYKRGT